MSESMYEIVNTCKGGGYEYARTVPPHPKANAKGLYPLHRVIVENHLGRNLTTNEEVHHKDKNKFNNDIDNLALVTKRQHAQLHNPVKHPVETICGNCGEKFLIRPHILRRRKKLSKSGLVFCSLKCARQHQSIHAKQVSKSVYQGASPPW